MSARRLAWLPVLFGFGCDAASGVAGASAAASAIAAQAQAVDCSALPDADRLRCEVLVDRVASDAEQIGALSREAAEALRELRGLQP